MTQPGSGGWLFRGEIGDDVREGRWKWSQGNRKKVWKRDWMGGGSEKCGKNLNQKSDEKKKSKIFVCGRDLDGSGARRRRSSPAIDGAVFEF